MDKLVMQAAECGCQIVGDGTPESPLRIAFCNRHSPSRYILVKSLSKDVVEGSEVAHRALVKGKARTVVKAARELEEVLDALNMVENAD